MRDGLVDEIYQFLVATENSKIFPYYQQLEQERLRYFVDRQFGNLFTSVRHGDRSVMIEFAHDLAKARHSEGVHVGQLCGALDAASNIITHRLYENSRMKNMKLLVHDNITLPIQLAIDEVEDTYDQLDRANGCIMKLDE